VSVVGIDSLRYFWRRKTPEETAHDLARVIRTYARRWHAKSIALIGYSFGADVLPFAYNRPPERVCARVTMLSLLGFAPAADFEIRVGGCLGLPPSANAPPARPEIAKVPPELGAVLLWRGRDGHTLPDAGHDRRGGDPDRRQPSFRARLCAPAAGHPERVMAADDAG
jgi:pimeloyl-ACP methyl ester carboxylesterase